MSELNVTILDTVTGETATDGNWSQFWWEEGNGSCDCNRELLFGDTYLGCKRYVIIKTNAGNIAELNQEYPKELWERYEI